MNCLQSYRVSADTLIMLKQVTAGISSVGTTVNLPIIVEADQSVAQGRRKGS